MCNHLPSIFILTERSSIIANRMTHVKRFIVQTPHVNRVSFRDTWGITRSGRISLSARIARFYCVVLCFWGEGVLRRACVSSVMLMLWTGGPRVTSLPRVRRMYVKLSHGGWGAHASVSPMASCLPTSSLHVCYLIRLRWLGSCRQFAFLRGNCSKRKVFRLHKFILWTKARE
jgi:hypothetical protein